MLTHSESLDRLFDTFLALQSREECYAYFEDLCTVKEVQDMAGRLEVAIRLARGDSYQSISKATDTSTATIGRVSRCLHYGAGGYRSVLDKLKEKEGDR